MQSARTLLLVSFLAACGDDGGGGGGGDGGPIGGDGGEVGYGTMTSVPNDQPKFGANPPYGYWEYLPSRYEAEPDREWPTIVFLTTINQTGNGNSDLGKVVETALPRIIDDGDFPAHDRFVVLMPQYSDYFGSDRIDEFLDWAKQHYRIDAQRVYLTGASLGAMATIGYVDARGDGGAFAAIVPISGDQVEDGCQFGGTPAWFFHGADDTTATTSAAMTIASVEAINACTPDVAAKATLYAGCGHSACAWDPTYDLSGMSAAVDDSYAPYDQNIYDWMLTHTR